MKNYLLTSLLFGCLSSVGVYAQTITDSAPVKQVKPYSWKDLSSPKDDNFYIDAANIEDIEGKTTFYVKRMSDSAYSVYRMEMSCKDKKISLLDYKNYGDFELNNLISSRAIDQPKVSDIEPGKVSQTYYDYLCLGRDKFVTLTSNEYILGGYRQSRYPNCKNSNYYDNCYATSNLQSNGVDTGTYTGEWRRNLPDGKGIFKLTDGSVYEGTWQSGELHGYAIITYANGDQFKGKFFKNKRQGYGIEKNKNGEEYRGNYSNDQRAGRGTWIYPNGLRVNTTYANNKSVSLDRNGFITWPNGDFYRGDVSNDNPNGRGVLTFVEGISIAGSFSSEGKQITTKGDAVYRWPNGQSITSDKDISWRELRLFESHDQFIFAQRVSASARQIKDLKEKNVVDEAGLANVYQRMQKAKYSSTETVQEALQFLADEDAAKSSKSTPLNIKKKREENIAREKIEAEEKKAKQFAEDARTIIDTSSNASMIGSCAGIMHAQAIRERDGRDAQMFMHFSQKYRDMAGARYANGTRYKEYQQFLDSDRRSFNIGQRLAYNLLLNASIKCKQLIN